MRMLGILFTFGFAFGIEGCYATGLQDIIESTFANAVVKIEARSVVPVFEGDVNICRSQGTGFLVAERHVATAAHVLELDQRCGPPTIIVKSRRHKLERLVALAASRDDVAVLVAAEAFPSPMCSLVLTNSDVFNTRDAVRFGIPGGLRDPEAYPAKIGDKDSEFAPLVVLTPSPAEQGESGGPIVYTFNVAGVLKAKHKQYTGYSFMMTASTLRTLLYGLGVKVPSAACNPVLQFGGSAANGVGTSPGLSAPARALVQATILEAASVVSAKYPGAKPIYGEEVRFSAVEHGNYSICTAGAGPFTAGGGPFGVCRSQDFQMPDPRVANEAVQALGEESRKLLWQKLIRELPAGRD